MKNLILSLAITLGSIAFADGGGSSIGPANPAYLNCTKLTGTVETVQTPAGEQANCILEGWHLFNEMYIRGLVTEHHYDGISMPNPAAVNCVDIGGDYLIRSTPAGEAGYCSVEIWTLFRVINVIND